MAVNASGVKGFQRVCGQSLSTCLGLKAFNASVVRAFQRGWGSKFSTLQTELKAHGCQRVWGQRLPTPLGASRAAGVRQEKERRAAMRLFALPIQFFQRRGRSRPQHKHHLTPDNHFCLSAPQRKLFKQTPSLASPTTLRAKPSAQVTFPPPRPTHAWGSERGQHPHHLTVSQN